MIEGVKIHCVKYIKFIVCSKVKDNPPWNIHEEDIENFAVYRKSYHWQMIGRWLVEDCEFAPQNVMKHFYKSRKM